MAPSSLHEHLTTLAYKEVRSIATRLGLRLRHQQQKADWITPVVTGWQKATTRHQWLARLSVSAQEAIARLLAAEQIPAPLFWGEYGPVRQVTANHHWTPPPWQAPATVSEELYYSGLLCPTPHPLARARVVSLPVDLRGLLAAEARRQKAEDRDQKAEDRRQRPESPPNVLSSAPLSSVPLSSGWALCHDVGQLLIYLQRQSRVRLLQGRWLARAQMAALNERLLAPVDVASITSQRRTPYWRLLMFLATVGDLQHQGQVTPAGWQWLAAAPASQLAWLQQSWLTAAPADRQAYALPDGAVARPWPQPLAHHLNTLATNDTAAPFTAGDLVHGLLRAEQPVAAFWGANFHSLTDLDTVVARLLVEVLQPVGLVAPQAVDHTPVTSWLACAPVDPLVIATNDAPPSHPAQLQSAAAAYDLYLPASPATGCLAAQAQISRYGRYQPPASRTTAAFHHYQLTPATLAAAATAGHGLATLNAALTTVGLALTPGTLRLRNRADAGILRSHLL